MPKKRKTRKQKLQTDQKRQVVPDVHLETSSSQKVESQTTHSEQQESVAGGMTFTLASTHAEKQVTPKASKPAASTIAIATTEYGYLGNDLMKTALLTGAIILAELLIRLVYLR